MLKQFYLLTLMLLCSIMTTWADEVTYHPSLDVNFRTASGNTGWQTVKSASDDGNTDFELTYAAGFFSLQKYTIADLKNATKLVLTLTVGSKSGVDAVRVWAFANNSWTAESGVDDIVQYVANQTGVAPRATEGTANTPLVTGAKVSGSSPAQATFTITGDALATIKANATEDGTFTLLLTNNDLTNSNNKRSYLSNNTANAEANRPTLVATIETPVVTNTTTGNTYADLNSAFAAFTGDADLVINADVNLTGRCTLNNAYNVTVTASKDITITGPKNAMWFLVNVNNATLKIGDNNHKITLDGNSDDRSASTNVDVARRENSTHLYLTNIEFKNFTCGANHLVGCKNNGGAIHLENVTFTNCSSTDALISNLREANDALLLKGYLNVDNCTGTTIYTAKNRIRLGDADGNSIYTGFTASNVITIGWGGTFAEGTNVVVKVPAAAVEKFNLINDEWSLGYKVSSGDLYMTKPAEPTAQIGSNTYADLVAALETLGDGDEATITLLADQEISSRVNIKNKTVTINGGKAIRRADSYKNGLLFLTQKPDTDYASSLTFDNVTLDDNNLSTTAAMVEASNSGTTTLKDVTVQNCATAADAVIVNKSGGKLTLDGVTFTNCTAGKATVFDGNSVTLQGANTIPSIYVEKTLAISTQDAVATSAIKLLTDDGRAYGIIVEGGDATQFTSNSYRLSQQVDGVYLMPKAVTASYTHPALLHSSSDIAAAKDRLATDDLAKAAYSRLEAQSTGSAAGAVETLKRMDQQNWQDKYSDYSNFTHAASDAKLAYELALRYQLKGNEGCAASAVNILNDWAANCKGMLRLKGYSNNIPDPNEYLICIQAYQFANAAELLRDYSGWNSDDFTKFQTWMKQTFADVAILFLENHHNNDNSLHYWLNWDLAALDAMLSVGILCDDAALVNYALAYTTSGKGTGNVNNVVVATHNDPDSDETLAQCQESGRDQGHSTLDITLLGVLCQTAQNIGIDLFTPYKALEMAEYVGKYNLKDASGNFVYEESKVPFAKYSNGEVDHTAISSEGRGTVRPCWELFHAYAKANNKADAYTEAWVNYQRTANTWGEAESTSTDELGFGSLMFGAAVTTTGIKEITGYWQNGGAETKIYDLQGRRVTNPSHGIYIVNGKKVVFK